MYALLIQETRDTAIIGLDPEGRIQIWNEGARRIYGYEDDEIRGKPVAQFYPMADHAAGIPRRELDQAREAGRFEDRGWRVRKDRSVFWAHVVVTPLFDEQGRLRGFSKVTRDESEQKKAEDFNRQATQRLERRVRERTEELTRANEALRREVRARGSTEEALRMRESELREAQRIASIGSWSWDVADDVVTWSEECYRILGVHPEATPPDFRSHPDVYEPESYARLSEAVRVALAEGTPYELELELRREDPGKESRWVVARGEPVRDTQGRIFRLRGTVQDVTARKRTESLAMINEARLKSVLDSAPAGLFIADARGNLEYLNPAGVAVWGAFHQVGASRYGEYEGWRLDDGKKIAADEWAMARAIFKGETVVSQRVRIRTFDGKEKFVLNAACPVWGPGGPKGGRILGGIAVTQDITELIRAEEALRRSEERFRTYAEAMPQMAFVADAEGNILYYNQRFYNYVGQTVGTGGWQWRDVPVVHPEDLQKTVETWTHSLHTGQTYQIEYRLRRHDGVYRWHLGRALPITDDHGKIQQWLGTNTDIHEQKQLAIELEKSVRARDEFLSIASHELKTPLSSLKIQAQMLRRAIDKNQPDTFLPEKVRRMAEQTDRQVSRLVRLVDDMLDVSRIESGRFVIDLEKFDFLELLREVVERLRPQMSEAGVEVQFEHLEPVPGEWDRFRIEQVVINLLTNAVRYGRGRPVSIRLERMPPGLRFTVRDQGLGISPEDQQRIFGRFERAVASSEVSGLGLGLYISREIVRRHGGILRVESEPGHGSVFIVELPLHAPESTRSEAVRKVS